ncbi:DoxX family protein [Salarchaeum sp. III]|uniref:DoxX family protein n=1 Tax=Salarchaeum sp. III TaxID=3107927 RepID=UPI002ED8C48B
MQRLATAPAHVEYVVDGAPSVRAIQFLVDVLSNPTNAALLGIGALSVLAAMAGYLRYRPVQSDVQALRDALTDYEAFLPWMLRLAVGLPLVGAGFAGYFFSPSVAAPTRIFQVAIGFLLLFGLATRAVAAVGLAGYLVGLAVHPSLVLASEYVGGFLALLLVGSGRPSADHLLHRVADAPNTTFGRIDPVHGAVSWFNEAIEPYRQYTPVVLRLGLGINFSILGFWEKLANPGPALAVVEKYDLTTVVPVDPGLWVVGAGLTELAIGVLLLAGLFTRATAAVGFVVLTTTLFGLPDDPVLAHVTLFGMTSALFVLGAGPYSIDAYIHDRGAPDETPAHDV